MHRSLAGFVITACALMGLLAFGEIAHWRASHRRLGNPTTRARTEAIVVLGYKNRGQRANYINRVRVRAAVRSRDPFASESTLVFCGGPAGGEVPEADVMEDFARRSLGYAGPSRLDRTSMSTWENIHNAIPLIETADRIKIVSNSLHAEKGRAYLWRLRPDLAERLVRGADYRIGEMFFLKPAAALIGFKNLRSLADHEQRIDSSP